MSSSLCAFGKRNSRARTGVARVGETLSLFKKGNSALMEHHPSHVTDDVLTWVKTFTIDLPLTGTQWAFGIGKEEAVTASAWHGYDAGMRVLTSMIDTLYRLPLSGVVLDRTASTLHPWWIWSALLRHGKVT